MYVELKCSNCDDSSLVKFSTLYKIWKEGYESMSGQHRDRARAVTNIRCHCGHNERYDSPMFQYIFQLIFDEFVKKEEV